MTAVAITAVCTQPHAQVEGPARLHQHGRALLSFAADMSAQAGVRWLAAQVADSYPRLDVLVNNAGGFSAHRHLTADGLERTFALNHLAPFLLTGLLLDRLTATAPARIVTVSSAAHAGGRIDFGDLQGRRDYSGQRAYSQSKLAGVWTLTGQRSSGAATRRPAAGRG